MLQNLTKHATENDEEKLTFSMASFPGEGGFPSTQLYAARLTRICVDGNSPPPPVVSHPQQDANTPD
jgi:hypothetical protein